MNERTGVLIAILSSALGGGAAVATRFMIGSFDPLTLATVRFGGGALLLLPIALLGRLSGLLSPASCGLLLTVEAALLLVLTLRKFPMPAAADVGDKSVFEHLARQRAAQGDGAAA